MFRRRCTVRWSHRRVALTAATAATAVLSWSPSSTSSMRGAATTAGVLAFSAMSTPRPIRHLDDVPWFPGATALDRDRAMLTVHNPADPTHMVGQVPIATRSDVVQAIDRSATALGPWRDGTTPAYRASLMVKWSQLIQQHKHDIATIMTLESSKPLRESLGEVDYGTSFIDYYAAEAMRSAGTLLPNAFANADGSPRGHAMAMQRPVGVTALITPWNFPIAMITRKVAPALAVGCTALVKPSELTPLTAMLLQELADQAGIPPNVLQTM
jgi:succinate-semialdehyde dehydrogenase / glutarate-semialdehyde dehydrogenase